MLISATLLIFPDTLKQSMLVGETCASSESKRDVFLGWADNRKHPFLFPNQYPVAYSFFGVGCILFHQFAQTGNNCLVSGSNLVFHEIVNGGYFHSDSYFI